MRELILGAAIGWGVASLLSYSSRPSTVPSTVPSNVPSVVSSAYADRPERQSCECLELQRLRALLELQMGVICDDSHCVPRPTPTAPNGGDLP